MPRAFPLLMSPKEIRMASPTPAADRAGPQDRVSRVLIWILVAVTIACSIGMLAATRSTYEQAAPIPQLMATADGTPVLTYADIVAGKSGFQKADLMDYGSLYGMGSSFGEDYTA
jgi:nitric oxide reductase subunit B